MRRDKIFCSKKGCENTHKEEHFNQGHPSWGEIIGIIDEEGEGPHLCPECMMHIKIWLNNKD